MESDNYKYLLEEANKEIDRVYDRLYKAEDEIERLETIINSRSYDIFAILISNDCSCHRLIEKSINKLVCMDCGLTYYVSDTQKSGLPELLTPPEALI